MSGGLSSLEIGHLARLYRTVQAARDVLLECGMPRELVFEIVHRGDVQVFWECASVLLENGVLVEGRKRLFETVRLSYPGNPLFAGQPEQPAEPSRSYRSGRDMYVVERAEGPIYFGAPPEPETTPPDRSPTSVFFVGTSPFDIDLGVLRADREFRAIQGEERPGALRVVSRTDTDLAERPDVLHLAGPVVGGPEALARRLRAYRDHGDFTLSGLVLSVSRSAEFADLFDGLVKTVVAWNSDIDDDTAIAFSVAMYRNLVQSSVRSLDAAARVAVEYRNLSEQVRVRSM
ncbi:effector-associated domain EAD1-containing protein [Lentzea sp. JNUCC 0626]|uniref:effector-associated domain EAD1-containing protein n=1 Tax=Lentzea sp. JNUCC 0626 TaxID=3367513 RepID=UPI003748C015